MRRYQRDLARGYGRDGVVACDSFGRADSTDLGSTDGIPWLAGQPGKLWVETAGNWEINSHRIGSQGSSPGGQGWLVTLDLGVSDYVLEWQLAYTVDANNNGITVAFVDGTNFIRLSHTSVLGFTRFTAGVGSAIGTNSTGVTPAIGDVVRVSKLGAAYTARIFRAGAQVGAAATVASETQGQSSTIVGLRAAAASVRWTNFGALRV